MPLINRWTAKLPATRDYAENPNLLDSDSIQNRLYKIQLAYSINAFNQTILTAADQENSLAFSATTAAGVGNRIGGLYPITLNLVELRMLNEELLLQLADISKSLRSIANRINP